MNKVVHGYFARPKVTAQVEGVQGVPINGIVAKNSNVKGKFDIARVVDVNLQSGADLNETIADLYIVIRELLIRKQNASNKSSTT